MNTTYVAKTPDENNYVSYDRQENETWTILLSRQMPLLQKYACEDYLNGLQRLQLPINRIPQCWELNELFQKHTQWKLIPVGTVLPLKDFFNMLSKKEFPVATFIRRREDLDYVNLPDIFHEIIGHCPLLLHPPFAEFLQAFGQKAMAASSHLRKLLGRLFFYTVETGLIATSSGLKVYGSGVLSSKNEIHYASTSPLPLRHQFDLTKIVQTSFGLEKMQTNYFVIDNLEMLYELVNQIDQILFNNP